MSLEMAVVLAREAQAAGLTVTRLQPTPCEEPCFNIQFWSAGGRLWAEGRHECEDSVRRAIATYAGWVNGPTAPTTGGEPE